MKFLGILTFNFRSCHFKLISTNYMNRIESFVSQYPDLSNKAGFEIWFAVIIDYNSRKAIWIRYTTFSGCAICRTLFIGRFGLCRKSSASRTCISARTDAAAPTCRPRTAKISTWTGSLISGSTCGPPHARLPTASI